MKLKIKVQDKLFNVEVGEINDRPIKVLVDGEEFDVWPEDSRVTHMVPNRSEVVSHQQSEQIKSAVVPISAQPKDLKTLKAPIPGVVISIEVSPGDNILQGQVVCVLEAMKMKNMIRSQRNGIIQFIPISVGQHVRHNEILAEFSD